MLLSIHKEGWRPEKHGVFIYEGEWSRCGCDLVIMRLTERVEVKGWDCGRGNHRKRNVSLAVEVIAGAEFLAGRAIRNKAKRRPSSCISKITSVIFLSTKDKNQPEAQRPHLASVLLINNDRFGDKAFHRFPLLKKSSSSQSLETNQQDDFILLVCRPSSTNSWNKAQHITLHHAPSKQQASPSSLSSVLYYLWGGLHKTVVKVCFTVA